MRNRYIVCYDIADQKRLAKVYRKMRGFGDRIQYSVFCCHLSSQERVMMIAALSAIIHHKDDRVMIVNTGPQNNKTENAIEFMGRVVAIDEPASTIV